MPTLRSGTLRRNANRRFEFDGLELSCGDPVEICYPDAVWISGRIEYDPDRGGYYFLAPDGVPDLENLEGLVARSAGDRRRGL